MVKIILEDWQVKSLREYFGHNDKTQTAHWAYEVFNKAYKEQCTMPLVSNWVAYDWNDISSRPPKYGKYFVHRKDGKVHWETWNGSGWAYNEKVITHWQEIKPPCS